MRRCKLKQFRSLVYALGSEPTLQTLRRHIDQKKIPGGLVDHGRYFVDLDEYDRATQLSSQIEERRRRLLSSPELKGLV